MRIIHQRGAEFTEGFVSLILGVLRLCAEFFSPENLRELPRLLSRGCPSR
jgi:hypothetical protein